MTGFRHAWALLAASLITLMAMASARAADLGGDCCADLEERIAELEATTARKGNRKVSLAVTGYVNKAVLGWDDGFEDNAYVVGNKNDQTNLEFVGEAQISPGWKAGYDILIRFLDNLSDSVDQNTPNAGDGFFLWQAHWFLESEKHGKVSVGLASRVTDTAPEADFSEAVSAGYAGVQDIGGAFILRRSDSAFTDIVWGDVYNHFNGDTANIVRYDSPELMGFIFSADWGEDDIWDVGVRYVYEGHGIQFEGVIAYTDVRDTASVVGTDPDSSTLVGSFSVLHEPSGLNFTLAGGQRYWDGTLDDADGIARTPVDTEYIYVKLGWLAKLTALGPTAFYGEYGWFKDYISAGVDADGIASLSFTDVANVCVAVGDACRVTGDEAEVWGVGVVQHIEAAAMELYIGYRHHTADFDIVDVGGNAVPAASIEAFDTIIAGSKISF
jgi:predicted porin